MIESRSDLQNYIERDLERHGLVRWRAFYRLTRRTVYYQWLLRRAEYWNNCGSGLLGRLMSVALKGRLRLLGETLGFTIPIQTFGPGLSIAHAGTVVVSPRASIGADCRIHQGVTIGEAPGGLAPVIGDRVHIAPNVCIIGRVAIGDDVGVAAGAVVTKDVPRGATVGGVPARIIKMGNH